MVDKVCEHWWSNSSNSAHAVKDEQTFARNSAMPFTMATYRFGERFDIDTIGPLPKDDYENEYVVVVRCVLKIRQVDTSEVNVGLDAARALIDFVGTFVCPCIIHLDRKT
jgi:hypothetical protein